MRLNTARPPAITAICVIGIINATQMLNLILSPITKQLGTIYPVYFSLSVIISLVCCRFMVFEALGCTGLYGCFDRQPNSVAEHEALGIYRRGDANHYHRAVVQIL